MRQIRLWDILHIKLQPRFFFKNINAIEHKKKVEDYSRLKGNKKTCHDMR